MSPVANCILNRAGLKPTGGGRSGCDHGGKAQVYVRGGTSQGRIGIIYSYYVPKVRWAKGNGNGHRHYWASVVVWVNQWGCDTDDISALWPVGISYTSDHLTWATAPAGEISFKPSGVGVDMATNPRMKIHDKAISPFTGADGDLVYQPTLISWDSLPEPAQKALTDVKYDKTQAPFNDANFQSQLDAAYREGFFAGLPTDADCISEQPDEIDIPDDPVTVTGAVSPSSTEME
ncbi:uncharacterized protein ColSpa_07707 [Colletotrichum spaethianum]|uniref:NPP1 domain-containing protein n=1 Tax=Colletotrichum spaethianum TaxID=700344 RepID=A0AA37P8C8_9PEZI|nr:uncharacterized protein ColSpa_07707 [Colletotrichum spaethianum]GKT47526.1 hypothetical protein ColSpa_07707 [Colletotrichum spaethianum]